MAQWLWRSLTTVIGLTQKKSTRFEDQVKPASAGPKPDLQFSITSTL